MADTALDEKARRVRNLLSSYYGGEGGEGDGSGGLGVAAEGTNTSKITGTRASGIDSATFDSARFTRSLLKGTRLDGLMSKHTEMSMEIKSLDGDMQMLVYENYNKFISATDTIRNMKSNVDGMGANMEELMSTIDSVAERSNAVNSKLQQRRDHVEELNRVRTLLKKLQVVFDLPKKLQAALDNDAMEIAVEQYCNALPVLKRFGHQGAFRSVASETDAMAKVVVAALRKRLLERKDEAAECIELLRKMGEPVEALQEDFLECRRIRMDSILRQAIALVDAMCKTAGLPGPEETEADAASVAVDAEAWGVGPDGDLPLLEKFVVELDSRFLGEVVHTVSSFTELFPDGRRRLLEVLKDLFGRYFAVVKQAISASSGNLANAAAGLSDDHCGEDYEAEGAQMPGALQDDWGGSVLVVALKTVKADVGRMVPLIPELSLQDRGSEVVEASVRHMVGACFRALELRVVGELRAAYHSIQEAESAARGATVGFGGGGESKQAGQVLLKAQARVAELLEQAPGSILTGMRALLDEGARLLDSWRDMYVDLVAGSLQNLVLALLAHFRALAGIPSTDGNDTYINMRYGGGYGGGNLLFPTTPRSELSRSHQSISVFSPLNLSLNFSFGDDGLPAYAVAAASPSQEPAPCSAVLLLACLATFMENRMLALCMERLALAFPGGGGGGGSDQPPAFVAGELARRISSTASAVLSAYVESHGRKISLMMRGSIEATDWLNCKEPRAPRAVCILVLERLAKAESEVVQLVGGGEQRSSLMRTEATEGSAGGQEYISTTSSLERNVAKLFTEKVKIFGDVDFSQGSILVAIARVGLKSWVECVRLETLGRAGLQQIQLDVHFLRPQLRRFAPASASVDSLLDEVLGAAVDRSLDPSMLESSLLDRILASYAQSRQ